MSLLQKTVWVNMVLLVVVLLALHCREQPTTETDSVLSEERIAEIQGILQDRVDKYKQSVGIVVGIINEKGRKIISYGKLSKNSSREVDGNTIFELGSVTKVFTGLLLAEIAERGELSLTDPIAKFLPESVKVPTRDGKEITLLHLATHTSGLPITPGNLAPKDIYRPYADYTVEHMYEFLSNYTLTIDIGSKIEYSNFGAGLLGHILALRAGVDYETLVVTRICEPLGMSSTRIKLSPELRARLATGHNKAGEAAEDLEVPSLAGAGALRSTANDMLTFLAANMGLSESGLWPAMQKTHLVRASTSESKQTGLGWLIGNKYGKKFLLHGGETMGFHSFIGFVEKECMGVVVLSNTKNIIDDIGKHLLDNKFELAKLELPRPAIEVDPEIYEAYVGKYEITPGIVFDVTTKNGKLMVQITGQRRFQVFPESDTTFFYKVVDAQITFVKNGKGQVTHLIKRQSGRDVIALRQGVDYQPPWAGAQVPVELTVLESYVGKYELEPGAVFTVTLVDGKLMVQFTGQRRLQVFPESGIAFFYKRVDAQIIFQKDEDGNVASLILRKGGQDHKAKKIE